MAITHLSIMTLNVNGINSPIKKPRWLNGLFKASINICLLYVVYKRYTSKLKTENESERIKKDIPSQEVNPKENQLWIFAGRTDAEAPVLWPPDEKS